MADIKYYDVILRPVITEKSMGEMASKKYTFLVNPDATKAQVREAVEKMFEGTKVKTAATKKAIVTLTEDSKEIEIFKGL